MADEPAPPASEEQAPAPPDAPGGNVPLPSSADEALMSYMERGAPGDGETR